MTDAPANENGGESKFVAVESRGGSGLTGLQEAVKNGDCGRVASLIEDGADVNQITVASDGNVGTALMTALSLQDPRMRLAMARMLVDAGASPNVVLCRGRNIALRHVLLQSKTEECLADLMALLIDAGAKPDPDLEDIAESKSFFTVTYLLRSPKAARRPVEETMGMGCCLIPLTLFMIVVAVTLYLLSLYKAWPFNGG